MTWLNILDGTLASVADDLPRLGDVTEVSWLATLYETIVDARDRVSAIREVTQNLSDPDAPASPLADPSMASLIGPPSIPHRNEIEKSKLRQLNSIRLAILDLGQICDELTLVFWTSLLTRKHTGGDLQLAERLIANRRIRPALSESCEVILPEGHQLLITLRNALVHRPIRTYASHVNLRGGSPQAGRPMVFEFGVPSNRSSYRDQIFHPLQQLGERGVSGANDFATADRRDLKSALWSAGRMTADLSAAFKTKIGQLR